MCELLIISRDSVNPGDVYRNAKLYKRGDVVVVQPDGWNWGKEELANPLFRILKLPNVDVATASTLLSWELPVNGVNASVASAVPSNLDNTCQRRKNSLNLSSPLIPAGLAAYIADDARAAASFASAMNISTFGGLQLTKAAIQNPSIIGTTTAVIG